jgi:hypothetical protein
MDIMKRILLIIGTLILLFSVLVDFLGIGYPGFGYLQITGSVVGVVIVIIGLVIKKKE